MPGRTDGLITLGAADALWVDLTADSAVPTASGAFTCSPARARVGYVPLGSHVVATVRASGGQSCNTQERPDHLYSNDIRVANRYTRLSHTDTDHWLRHWHRCPGCRARTTLPLPHLAAWTAHIACRLLRPTHRAPRGRKPCGVLRVSWTGSQNAPRREVGRRDCDTRHDGLRFINDCAHDRRVLLRGRCR